VGFASWNSTPVHRSLFDPPSPEVQLLRSANASLSVREYLKFIGVQFYGQMGLGAMRVTSWSTDPPASLPPLYLIYAANGIGGLIPVDRSAWITLGFGSHLFFTHTIEADGHRYSFKEDLPEFSVGFESILLHR
jgi:hypothetical protein